MSDRCTESDEILRCMEDQDYQQLGAEHMVDEIGNKFSTMPESHKTSEEAISIRTYTFSC